MGRRFIRWGKKRVPRVSRVPRARKKVEWVEDKKVEKRISELVSLADLKHVSVSQIFCYRSCHAKTRAYARIWGFPRIWQQALGLEPAYVIEVISEKFDRLPQKDQDMILIHELLHIPRTFSGALVPHHARGGVNEDRVREIYRNLKIKK